MIDPSAPDTVWTSAHDLALIFIALAFGTDSELTDVEIEQVSVSVVGWMSDADQEKAREIVLEALAVYELDLRGDEVIRAIETLSTTLDPSARRRALEDAMRIAESDGLLLTSERTLLDVLAASWDLRAHGKELVERSAAKVDDRPLWTLLHDIGVLAVAIAHGSDGSLESREIDQIVRRLSGWRVDLETDDLKAILYSALEAFGKGDLNDEIRRSAISIKERLPQSLRLIVLDDLIAVAEADGPMNEAERGMISSLALAWQLGVRFEA